jgi:hypothetical protein
VAAMPVVANAYNSLWQVRNDAWSSLEESTSQLALAGAQQRPVEELIEIDDQTFHPLVRIQIAGRRHPGWIHIPDKPRGIVTRMASDRRLA